MDFDTAMVIVYRRRDGHKVEFLAFDYQYTLSLSGELSDKEIRFPTGSNREYPGETPQTTAARKLFEETGLIAWDLKLVGEDRLRDKYVYAVDIDACGTSCMRLHEALEKNGDVMSPPFWMDVDVLQHKVAAAHRWVYDAGWEEICTPQAA